MAGVSIPEGVGLEAPPGAEKLKVKLRDVSVEGIGDVASVCAVASAQ
jgi:hypothetical protein